MMSSSLGKITAIFVNYMKTRNHISFDEATHTYTMDTNPNAKFVSSTQLIHSFAPKMDTEFWLLYKAYERLMSIDEWSAMKHNLLTYKVAPAVVSPEVIAMKEVIRAEWVKAANDACTKGTAFHKRMEDWFYKVNTNIDLGFLGIDGKYHVGEGAFSLEPEVILSYIRPEQDIYIAGQADLFVQADNNDFFIVDWKGLTLDTLIPSFPNGTIPLGELKEGDYVMGSRGEFVRVTKISEVHEESCYEMEIGKETIRCDIYHTWMTSDGLLVPNSIKERLDKGAELHILTPHGKQKIKSMRRIGLQKTKCITVDSDDHLYCVTDSHLICHNTNKELKFRGYSRDGIEETLLAPLQELPACNFSEYQMQLSLYAWMIEQSTDLHCRGLVIGHKTATGKQIYRPEYRPDLVKLMIDAYGDRIKKETTKV